MKKLLLACLLLVSTVTFCNAQGGGGRGMMADPAERAKKLQTQLKLTDDQTSKITTILKAQAAKRDSIFKAANGDRSVMRSAMMTQMMTTNDKIKAVLTDDQKKQYEQIVQEQLQRMQQMRGGQGGGGAPQQN